MNIRADALKTILRKLAKTQYLPSARLDEIRYRQLGVLAEYCEKHSPYFRARLENAGLQGRELCTPQALSRLPLLTRRELQVADGLYCDTIPEGHGPVHESRTSGSTGEPVVVHRTAVSNMDWMAMTMRGHLWHELNFRGSFCAIRANISSVLRQDSWGPPMNWMYETGPLLGLPITMDIDRQLDMLMDFKPNVLLIYPSNLAALARKCQTRAIALPSVGHIYTIGETLSPQTRAEASRVFAAKLADNYSSQEIGIIARQCPMSDLYHVMAENMIVEIVHSDGTPCEQGESGRVVITDLRNFATPLIRYDIGDYAVAGPPCPCGRTLPTLARIFGRERNLIAMPDGTRHWPLVGFQQFREIAPIVQYQFIQESIEFIEMRLVTERALSTEEENKLRVHVQKTLGFPFALRFVYFEGTIPVAANGKFEEFVCRVN